MNMVILFIGLVLLTFFGLLAGMSALSTRRIRNLLRGNLYEDYIHAHEDLCRQGQVVCWKCRGSVVWVHVLQRNGEDILNEHLCKNCGERLFLSVNGPVYKKLANGLVWQRHGERRIPA